MNFWEKSTCRLCKATENVIFYPLFENPDENMPFTSGTVSLPVQINNCLSIEVKPDDGLPTWICHLCLFYVETCYTFKKKCVLSTQELKKELTLKHAAGHLAISEEPQVLIIPKQPGHDIQQAFDPLAFTEAEVEAAHLASLEEVNELEVDSEPVSQSMTEDIPGVSEDVSNKHPANLNGSSSVLPGASTMCKSQDKSSQETLSVSKQAATGKKLETMEVSSGRRKNNSKHVTNKSLVRCSDDAAMAKTTSKSPTHHTLHHLSTHEVDEPYVCSVCKRSFTSGCSLKKHMKIHEVKNFHTCEVCQSTFSDYSNYLKHKEIHNGKTYQCPHCIKSFLVKSYLAKHLKKYHSYNPIAALVTAEPTPLSSHESVVKTVETEQEAASLLHYSPPPSSPSSSSASSPLPLEQTTPHFQGWITAELKSEVPSPDETAMDLSEEYPIMCRICYMQFQNVTELNAHILSHTDVTYTCNACLETFSSKKLLSEHVFTVCTSRPYECKTCSKTFSTRPKLKLHELKHVQSDFFKCDECAKLFKSARLLLRHKNSHEMQLCYNCPTCNKSFYEGSSLLQHAEMCTSSESLCNFF